MLGHRSPLVPSAVWLGPDGERLFGEAAIRRGSREPQGLAREFKRRLGDSVPLILGGAPVSADQLTSMLLVWIVEQVAASEGEPPGRICVTHPANWGPYRREILAEAVRAAGFADAELLAEPDAAALYYASTGRVADGEVVVVYDLGGGTFDVAVLQRRGDRFSLLGAPDGVERLGGIDFDAAVFAHVRRWVAELERPDADDAWRAAVRRLAADCVDAKEALSSDVVADISVMLPARHLNIRLVRSEFEAMIRPSLSLTIDAVHRALTSAGLAPDDVTRVLLVGGSSRIPLVGELVGAEVRRSVSIDVHPKFAVALGAAIAARSGGFIDEGVQVAGSSTVEPAGARRDAPASLTERDLSPSPELPRRQPASATVTEPEDPSAAPAEDLVASAPEPILPVPLVAPGPRVRWSRTDVRRLLLALTLTMAGVLAALLVVRAGNGPPVATSDTGTEPVTTAPIPTSPPVTTVPQTVPTPRVVDLGATPGGLSVGFGSAWVASLEGELIEVDPVTARVTGRVDLEDQLDDVVVGTEAVWVTGMSDIHRVDAATGTLEATLELSGRADALAATPEGIWVGLEAADASGELYRIDESTSNPVLIARLPTSVSEIAVDAGTIWLTSSAPVVHRIDRATGTRRDIDIPAPAQGMSVAFDSVWITVSSTNQLLRLDPMSGEVMAEIATGAAPNELELGDGVMWFTEEGTATVAAVDPAVNEIVERLDTGTGPDRVVWSDPVLLVANAVGGSLSVLVP